jgi:hypothetical protein
MDGIVGVKEKLFKLRAKLLQCETLLVYKYLDARPPCVAGLGRIQNLRFAHILCGAQQLGKHD